MNEVLRWQWSCFSVALVIFALAVAGCVGPKIVTPTNANLQNYKQVYLMEPKPDPEFVTPRVATRLKQIGFKVVEIKPDDPSVDIQGTGFVITSSGYLLTCAHVVGDQPNATVWIAGQRYVCHVVAADTNLDLALLSVDGEHQPFTPLKLDTEVDYRLGQDVFNMGFPLVSILGTSPRLTEGLVSATVGMDDDPHFLQFSAPVQPGNSGGPLLNSKVEVIGVVAKTLSATALIERSGTVPQNVNFAIKMDSVRKFFDEEKIKLPEAADAKYDDSFDMAQKSLGLVRAGIVTDEELKQPSLACAFDYIYFNDIYNRFRVLEVRFYDWKDGTLILKAGQYVDDLSTEDGELDRIFRGVADKFFPGRPDPFMIPPKSP